MKVVKSGEAGDRERPCSGLRLIRDIEKLGPTLRTKRVMFETGDMSSAYILGIESSCDETAAAVVRSGEQLISNVVASQIATHQPYGGVVPELASREHLRAIVPVVRQALAEANHTYESVDAIAVTQGPGLAGALLVGISYAKALAFALDKPLIAVNHLEGHIHAVLLEERQKGNHEMQFPVLALVVSGGHTHLYLAAQKGNSWTYENIGHTRDDAAGEAFDKVAKLLGLGYPGGPAIDRLAPHGDPKAVKFPPAQIKHRDRRGRNDGKAVESEGERPRFDFSYSGIKTAILRYVEAHNMRESVETRRQALWRALRNPSWRTTSQIVTSSLSTWWHLFSAPLWKTWWERH